MILLDENPHHPLDFFFFFPNFGLLLIVIAKIMKVRWNHGNRVGGQANKSHVYKWQVETEIGLVDTQKKVMFVNGNKLTTTRRNVG